MNEALVNLVHRHHGSRTFRCCDRRWCDHDGRRGFHRLCDTELRVAIALASNRPYLLCGKSVSSVIVGAGV